MKVDNHSDEQLTSRVIDEAADWLARMHSKNLSDAEKNAWEQWLIQSAEHQRVWKNAELLADQFNRLEPKLGMSVLDRPRELASRRRFLRAVATSLFIPAATWFGVQYYQANQTNFYRTATGERREIILADRSVVVLNTATALNVNFDNLQRLLEHKTGEIFVRTAPDTHASSRPFLVETDNGRMRALGTEFVVRHGETGTRLSVFEGAVEITTRHSQSRIIVESGQEVNFTARSIDAITPIQSGAGAWRNGVLYAQGMRLADFTKELARYRPGLLHCNPAVGELRVTGVFRLTDTDTVLRLLADTLPVTIDARTRYWVTINPRQ
ncbi:FecR domain-containing protein [Cellvibrio sp. KY-YJ-3]|uniref:FecR domain-containing protein n=1 Tax=Cellvibrio sp. KY-YJ-3 TaxID=454662 RepID=UPI00124857C9|nr:FecR family protein [Cellvibrio sp. KY-YJ-3]QEY13271.1 FecR family protein [Cellvibrio sp. KY-YJ-3]